MEILSDADANDGQDVKPLRHSDLVAILMDLLRKIEKLCVDGLRLLGGAGSEA